ANSVTSFRATTTDITCVTTAATCTSTTSCIMAHATSLAHTCHVAAEMNSYCRDGTGLCVLANSVTSFRATTSDITCVTTAATCTSTTSCIKAHATTLAHTCHVAAEMNSYCRDGTGLCVLADSETSFRATTTDITCVTTAATCSTSDGCIRAHSTSLAHTCHTGSDAYTFCRSSVGLCVLANTTSNYRTSSSNIVCLTNQSGCNSTTGCIKAHATNLALTCHLGAETNTFCRDTNGECSLANSVTSFRASTSDITCVLTAATCTSTTSCIRAHATSLAHTCHVGTEMNSYCRDGTGLCVLANSVTSFRATTTDITCVTTAATCSTTDGCIRAHTTFLAHTCHIATEINTFCRDGTGLCILANSVTSFRASTSDISCVTTAATCSTTDGCIMAHTTSLAHTCHIGSEAYTFCRSSDGTCALATGNSSFRTSSTNILCLTDVLSCNTMFGCVSNSLPTSLTYTCMISSEIDTFCRDSNGYCSSILYVGILQPSNNIRTSTSNYLCTSTCQVNLCVNNSVPSGTVCIPLSSTFCGGVTEICTSQSLVTTIRVRTSLTNPYCTSSCLTSPYECIESTLATFFYCREIQNHQCGNNTTICQSTSVPLNLARTSSSLANYTCKTCSNNECIENFVDTNNEYCVDIYVSTITLNSFSTTSNLCFGSAMLLNDSNQTLSFDITTLNSSYFKYSFSFYLKIISFLNATTYNNIFTISNSLKLRYNSNSHSLELFDTINNRLLNAFAYDITQPAFLNISLSVSVKASNHILIVNGTVCENLIDILDYSTFTLSENNFYFSNLMHFIVGRFEFVPNTLFYGVHSLSNNSNITNKFSTTTKFSKVVLLSGYQSPNNCFNNSYFLTYNNPMCIYISDIRLNVVNFNQPLIFKNECTSYDSDSIRYFNNYLNDTNSCQLNGIDQSVSTDQEIFSSCKHTGIYNYVSNSFKCSCSAENYDFLP
ncbi:hypothetical protein, partial [uncultured Flavobacterium sp.]|uniref:hypothetical protein n=1 Tax=uncultured Flavobacterium sp. TaxID=165435 RepID=UPI002599AAF3